MKINDIQKQLDADVIFMASDAEDITINNVTISDLMSDVLVVDEHELMIVSSLATDQVLRTADIVCASCVVIVNGKNLSSNMIERAEEFDITLLRTPHTTFDTCAKLKELMDN
ncbi:MAG: DRTGG domain-containing protein [Kiritimatiellae bacterium]|jgi:ATP:corrinoid adenosyltransferase|nr:DRTGG domain-containing protein [Kiritimatiellia bacterium]